MSDAGGFTERAIFGELMATYCKSRSIKGIVCDDDGVLFIRPDEAEALAAATKAVEKKEAGIMEHILHDGTYIRPWVDEKLREIGCEVVD